MKMEAEEPLLFVEGMRAKQWRTNMYKQLFIPGPVDVDPEILKRMGTPMIGHRTKEATELQKGISEKLQELMFTKNTIVLSTSSGSGLMESAIRCCTKKKVAVFSVGAFGDRWYDMAISNGKAADIFHSPDGEPTTPEMVDKALATGAYDCVTVTHNETSSGILNPCAEIGEVIKRYDDVFYLVDAVSSLGGSKVEVDAWGIDFCITSTQKCMGLPAGMSFASVSDRAYDRAKTVKERGFYFDIVSIVDRVRKNYQYPSTPSLEHMFALDYQLDQILQVEGLQNRFDRHAELSKLVQAWAEKHFALFAKEGYRSHTVTCIKNPEGFDFAALNAELGRRGYMISGGYGKHKASTFRIAHMADRQKDDMVKLLEIIDEILGH